MLAPVCEAGHIVPASCLLVSPFFSHTTHYPLEQEGRLPVFAAKNDEITALINFYGSLYLMHCVAFMHYLLSTAAKRLI